MKAHLHYTSYVIRHKWFVFRAPLWRLIIHDWSKMTVAEWGPYVRTFYGRTPGVGELRRRFGGRPNDAQNLADWKADRQAAFDKAWLHHQHRNPHHWQHWLLREDDGDLKALAMPEKLIREMVADWMGAGRAITGRWDVLGWYKTARTKMVLHPATRQRVEELIPGYAEWFKSCHEFDLPVAALGEKRQLG